MEQILRGWSFEGRDLLSLTLDLAAIVAMRSLAETAAILHGRQKADVALQSASDNWPLIPGYDAACLEWPKPT